MWCSPLEAGVFVVDSLSLARFPVECIENLSEHSVPWKNYACLLCVPIYSDADTSVPIKNHWSDRYVEIWLQLVMDAMRARFICMSETLCISLPFSVFSSFSFFPLTLMLFIQLSSLFLLSIAQSHTLLHTNTKRAAHMNRRSQYFLSTEPIHTASLTAQPSYDIDTHREREWEWLRVSLSTIQAQRSQCNLFVCFNCAFIKKLLNI